MADNAPITQYREEAVMTFEQNQSLIRESTTTEAVIKGNTATFLVAGSGGAEATTRGLDGLISARPDSNTQTSATLAEWHDLVRKTRFNIFESQGAQREIMQKTTAAVINRKIDSDIIVTLDTGTVKIGSTTPFTADLANVMTAKTLLGNADVPWDSNITALITPGFEAYLMQTREFAGAEYINQKPMQGADAAWRDKPQMFMWVGVMWIVHPNLPGAASSDETCFMYHKAAVGHAYDNMDVAGGYNDEQSYYWTRCSIFMGSAKLQNSGIVEMHHDSSALVAS